MYLFPSFSVSCLWCQIYKNCFLHCWLNFTASRKHLCMAFKNLHDLVLFEPVFPLSHYKTSLRLILPHLSVSVPVLCSPYVNTLYLPLLHDVFLVFPFILLFDVFISDLEIHQNAIFVVTGVYCLTVNTLCR